MSYKQYYQTSYDRLPPQVQEGLKQQYGTNDWPTALRMWDQERGVQYNSRPTQSPGSFNRSTYEKGTYTLPSPISRAFTRLGQGVGNFATNAYNSASQGLAEWGKRNPGWERAVGNMMSAIGEAQYKGQYGLAAGSKAFGDTLDPDSDYNIARRQKLRELNPAQAKYEDTIQAIMLSYGLSRQDAEAKYRTMSEKDRQHELDKREADVEYTKSRTALNKSKASLTDAKALTEETKRAVDTAKASYYTAKTDREREEAARLVIITRKEEELLETAKNNNLSKPGKKLQEIKDTVDAEGRWDEDPQGFKKEVQRRFRLYATQQATLDDTAVKQEMANLEETRLGNENQRLSNILTQIDISKAGFELQKAVEAWRNMDFNSLSTKMKEIFNSAKNAPGGSVAAGWMAVEEQIKRDIRGQEADITAQEIANETPAEKKMREIISAVRYLDMTPEEKQREASRLFKIWTDQQATLDATAVEQARAKLAETLQNTLLTDARMAEIYNKISGEQPPTTQGELEIWGMAGYLINAANRDDVTRIDEKYAKVLASSYSATTEGKEVLRKASEKLNNDISISVKDAIAEASKEEGMTAAQINAQDATVREFYKNVAQDKAVASVDAATGKTDQRLREDQVQKLNKDIAAADKMIGLADSAMIIIRNAEDAQFGTLQTWYNTFLTLLSQLSLSSEEMDKKATAANLLDQISTEFALIAVQQTKGAISDAEMRLFRNMYLSLNNTRKSNLLRMRMVKYISTVKSKYSNAILAENLELKKLVEPKREAEIAKEIRKDPSVIDLLLSLQRDLGVTPSDNQTGTNGTSGANNEYANIDEVIIKALKAKLADPNATIADIDKLKGQYVNHAKGSQEKLDKLLADNPDVNQQIETLKAKGN